MYIDLQTLKNTSYVFSEKQDLLVTVYYRNTKDAENEQQGHGPKVSAFCRIDILTNCWG